MKENITPHNAKYEPHGYWVMYYYNGQLYSRCVYINGNENGVEEYYRYDDGKVTVKNYYL